MSLSFYRQYFKEQLMAQTTGIEVIEEQKRRLAEQHEMCIKENELWNAEVKKIRDARLAKEAKEREEKILQKMMDYDKKRELFIEQLDAHISAEKVTMVLQFIIIRHNDSKMSSLKNLL